MGRACKHRIRQAKRLAVACAFAEWLVQRPCAEPKARTGEETMQVPGGGHAWP